MHHRKALSSFLLLLALWLTSHAAQPAKSKSALETDATGWTDLMPGKDLKGWKRVPIAPDEKLNAKNPWSLSEGKTLLCDGVGVKEMLLYDREFKDGIYHIEWRFRKVEGKTGYNSGIYVRTSGDGKVWHQAQVAHQEKAPQLGDLFGETLVEGKPMAFKELGKGHQLGREPGEWNTYEITCKGKDIRVWINGAVATQWNNCQVPKGYVGLQAEFWFIEFRTLKFKEL